MTQTTRAVPETSTAGEPAAPNGAGVPVRPGREHLSGTELLLTVLIAAATFALYIPSLSNHFVDFDDHHYVTANPVVQGERIYLNNCQGCHQQNGRGVPAAFPPVVGSEWVTGAPETLVRILLQGLSGPVQVAGATFNGAMPAWKDVLKDEEIAAVATYLRQWKPNAAGAVSGEQVASLRQATASRTAAWTVAELKAAEGAPSPEGGRP